LPSRCAPGTGSPMTASSAVGGVGRRHLVLQQFFAQLERRYGGIPLDPSAVVLKIPALTNTALVALVQHKISAIHVPNFIPSDMAARIGQELEVDGSRRNWRVSTSRGLESSDVATAGAHGPYNTVQSNDEKDSYFTGVRQELHDRRIDPRTNQPRLWPLDLLRLQLDESWTAGCGLAKDKTTGRSFGGGLPRIMEGPTRWKHGLIHVDEMGPLSLKQGLFSANIYLQLPTEPRETLHIWPTAIFSRWDWYRNAVLLSGLSTQDPDSQARLRRELGAPQIVVAAPGDLVLLCVQRPHAAVGFRDGTRISLQCFLQYEGLDQRLLIDC
jgi:hypothetical protein